MDTPVSVVLVSTAWAVSAVAVLVLSRFAFSLGLVDVPGGRKAHHQSVPVVGGISIFVAVLLVAFLAGIAQKIGYFLLALSVVIAIGFWDDVTDIKPRVKLGIQVAASAIMIWGAGIKLYTVGDLFGVRAIGLSVFIVPLTIFAMVGVVNAINMMDGLDGLGGSVAFTAFAWYAIVAADSGLATQFTTALIFCSAIGGFLIFNLRFPWRSHARVFLGDAGSLMLGFSLGWFAIDLTQGFGRSFPPMCALWVLLLPLADCVSLLARRLTSRKSPFDADRQHIHHYLLAKGFNPSQTLAVLVTLSVLFGAVGYFGWKFHVPEPVLFYPFFFGFFAYHFWISREWRRIERCPAEEPSELPAESQIKPAE